MSGAALVLSDDFQRRVFYGRFYAKPEWTDRGLLVGAGTCVLAARLSARNDDAGERLLTVLSAAGERPVTKAALGHVEAARIHWQRGDGVMAHIRLAFAQLPALTKVGAYRAFLADRILADMSPAALRKHLSLVEPKDVAKSSRTSRASPQTRDAKADGGRRIMAAPRRTPLFSSPQRRRTSSTPVEL